MKIRRILLSVLPIVILLALVLSFSACDAGEPAPKVTKLGEIEDITKGYFGEDTSTVTVKLSDYVEPNGTTVYYTVTGSDSSVADLTFQGDELNIKLKKGEGSTDVTVTVSAEEKECFKLEFTVTAKTYSSIACVGDSLTAGHTWPQESYPVYLADKLGSGYTVGNYGVNGASITGTNPGPLLKYTDESKNNGMYSASLAANADVVIIMLGTNDAKDWTAAQPNYKDWYIDLIKSYQTDNPDVKIILVSAPPTMENNKFSLPNTFIKNFVCPIQRSVAEDLELPLIDLRQIMESRQGGYDSLIRGDAAFDGVHLSVEGAELLAELIIAELKKL